MYTQQETDLDRSLEVSILSLIEELNDTTAEKLCGGSTITPEVSGEDPTNQSSRVDTASIPSTEDFQQLGLQPFFPVLSNSKLPRLGHLDPANRTPSTPKNSITITIPLPLPPLAVS
jgi:hypothetical protein